MSFSRPVRPGSRAFTLIELLTVIAIIGILAAILIPTVGKVRSSARNSQCVSRLHEWGNAVHLHANDNKGRYQISNWASAASNPYQPYFPKFTNAEAIKFFGGCPLINQSLSDNAMCYSFIQPSIDGDITKILPDPASGNQFVTLSRAAAPSKFLVMSDTMKGSNPRINASDLTQMIDPLFGAAIVNSATRGDDTVALRHGGKQINGVFADGSVKRMTGSPAGSGDVNSIYEMRTTWFQLY